MNWLAWRSLGGVYRAALLAAATLVGCSNGGAPDAGKEVEPIEQDPDPFLEKYAAVQDEAEAMDLDEFLATYPQPTYVAELSYDPMQSIGLDAIEQVWPVDGAAETILATNGFVAIPEVQASTFEAAYDQIYYADLPVLVTGDSVLYALHRSFDAMLMDLERAALVPELDLMLREMHEGLEADLAEGVIPPGLDASVEDLDVYLTVARRLLASASLSSATGKAADERADRIMAAIEAQSVDTLQLFGRGVTYDYSQLVPRGHYEDEPALQQYFRAMMWLGRTDFQLVYFEEEQPFFNRQATDAAIIANHLLESTGALERWSRIDRVLRTMIGEPDSMSPADLPTLAEQAGGLAVGDLPSIPDERIYEPLARGRFGLQRIMSQIMYTDPMSPPIMLPRVYLLLGQRFTIDSYVFNNVTYDRVQNLEQGVKVTRMLPDELDVQFVLGNNEAGHLLTPQLEEHGYQGVLHELRYLVDSHPAEFWDDSFYAGWLSSLRALNADPAERDKYPEPMRTQAWQHKTLNTQSASRAELRHDTLLYVKQSYSGGNGCEYPDGYVEPLAGFYGRLAHLGELGIAMVDEIEAAGYDVAGAREYFQNWSGVMATLQGIADRELAGEPLDGEQIAFLGQVVEQELVGCGEVQWDGWYPSLFYDPTTLGEYKPTIADVHTAPTDAAGTERGWVLHAATGRPMLLVLTVPSCDGTSSSAYVGPISSYHPVLTEGYQRLTDSDWSERLNDPQARPEWTGSFVP